MNGKLFFLFVTSDVSMNSQRRTTHYSLTPDKELNILIHEMLSVSSCTGVTNCYRWFGFSGSTCIRENTF